MSDSPVRFYLQKKPLRLLYSIYEKPRRKRKLAFARFLSSQPCQTKKARLEKDAKAGTSPTSPLHRSPEASALHSPHSLASSGLKSTANGLPASKRDKFSGALSLNRTKKKVLKAKKDALKSRHAGGKVKLKAKGRLPFDRGEKGGRGRKKMKATERVSKESHSSKPDVGADDSIQDTKNGSAKLPASDAQLDTKPARSTSPGFSKSNDSITNGAKPAQSHRNGSARSTSPTLQASFYRKVVSATTTLSNGTAKPSAKVAHLKQSKSRSSSPKLSTPGSSRSASPKLPGVVNRGSRPSSPKLPGVVSRGSRPSSPRLPGVVGKGSRSSSPKLLGVVSRGSRCSSPRPTTTATGKESPRPSSRGSSRTDSPRPADVQRGKSSTGAVMPSLPVEEKISVDVTMAASSSETSSDVTSPGAEDRANSTGLEEPGDFEGGGHVCNVAVFGPRPLPSLAPLPGGGQGKGSGKGSQTKDSAKTGKPSQTLTKADGRTPNNKKR